MSDSLWSYESRHARPPCPSPTPGAHSNSRLSSLWCHPAISSSVIPFSSGPQSLPASESFPMSQLFAWGGQSIGVSALASFLPKNTLGWSPLEWTGWISLQSKGLSRVFSNTRQIGVVKQEMARLKVNIPGISELKWTEMGEFNSDDHYIYYWGQESLRRNGVAIMVIKRIQNAVLGCNLKNDRMISVRFQGKPFNITVIQVYAPTVTLKKLKLKGSMKTYKAFQN